MPEVDFDQLVSTAQAFQAGGQFSFVALAQPYSIEAIIRAFSQRREALTALIAPLDDVQVRFKPAPEEFSIGEVVSHMVAAQGGVYNALLDLSEIVMPFINHVPGGPGAGAQNRLNADEVRAALREATEEMIELMRQSARVENPPTRDYPNFGKMSLKSWMLFQIFHDHDHVQQAEAVARLPAFPKRQLVATDQP
jgi:hypothetical protein